MAYLARLLAAWFRLPFVARFWLSYFAAVVLFVLWYFN
jgi:hypothetical protein